MNRVCEQCPNPIKAATLRRHPSTRFCSKSCRGAASRLPDNACTTCGSAFWPRYAAKRYCSVRCIPRTQPPPRPARRMNELLQLLRDVDGTWLTLSDMAILIYGGDSQAQCYLATNLLARLREQGHVFAHRKATWMPFPYATKGAYRLVEAISEVAA